MKKKIIAILLVLLIASAFVFGESIAGQLYRFLYTFDIECANCGAQSVFTHERGWMNDIYANSEAFQFFKTKFKHANDCNSKDIAYIKNSLRKAVKCNYKYAYSMEVKCGVQNCYTTLTFEIGANDDDEAYEIAGDIWMQNHRACGVGSGVSCTTKIISRKEVQ